MPLDADVIWATRGRTWGFRFLLRGGHADPLPAFERSFAEAGDGPSAYHRSGGTVALRFPDPLGRRDAAGRVIPHEFVISGELAEGIGSVGDGLERIWPLVAKAYAGVWDAESPA